MIIINNLKKLSLSLSGCLSLGLRKMNSPINEKIKNKYIEFLKISSIKSNKLKSKNGLKYSKGKVSLNNSK